MSDGGFSNDLDEVAVTRYITDSFENVHVVEAEGDRYFTFGPMNNTDNKFPFATLITSDAHDTASQLNRPGVFRLNIGVTKATFLALFGAQVSRPGEDGIIVSGYDYTRLDEIMPHPVYGNMFWLCVLNPSPATFQKVVPLLAEAYDMAVKQMTRREGLANASDSTTS